MRATTLTAGVSVFLLGVAACGSSDDSGGGGSGAAAGSGASAGAGGSGAAGAGGSGASSGSGGSSASGGAGGSGGGVPSGAPLEDRLSVSQLTVPEGVMRGVSNWRIWGRDSLKVAPVFTAPRSDCSTLVCYTTGSGGSATARVAHVAADGTLVESFELGTNRECRGLAAAPDGSFAALLWDDAGDRIYLHRYDASGSEQSPVTELTNGDNKPDDFGIGDSRVAYGDGKYGAYYHVHSDSGHEGDTLKWVDAASGAESTGWKWGCSHSMSNVLRFNPADNEFLPACVTDCFPGTSGDFSANAIGGIYLNHRDGKVIDVNAGCNGSVAGELGSAALAPSGFQLVFNAHQNAATKGQGSYDASSMNQDIGLAAIGSDMKSSDVVWLTNTPNIDEADSSIARWQPEGDSMEQYVVGWAEPGGSYEWVLARVDASGSVLEGPTKVTGTAAWGRRDDPFRVDPNGDVVWAWFDDAGSTTLNFARLSSGASGACGN